MKKRIKQVILLFMSVFYVDTAFSQYNLKSGYDCRGRIPVYACYMRANFYAEVSLGAAFLSHFGVEKSMIYLPSDPKKQAIFNIRPINNEQFLPQNFALGFGYSWIPTPHSDHFFPGVSIGLSYQKTNFKKESTAMHFDIQDLPNQKNIDLKFKPTFYQDTLFTNIKVNLMRFCSLMPYFKTGMGLSWNTMAPEQVESGLFEDKKVEVWIPISKKTSLAFQMGLGLDFLAKENLLVSFGYTYTQLGALQSAKPQLFLYEGDKIDEEKTNQINSIIKAFHFGNLTTHNLEISLRYLFA